MEYNFQYLLGLYNASDDNFERTKVMNAVDKKVSELHCPKNNFLFHIVPFLYSSAFIAGLNVFVYKLFM
jgi:hypothetical protein